MFTTPRTTKRVTRASSSTNTTTITTTTTAATAFTAAAAPPSASTSASAFTNLKQSTIPPPSLTTSLNRPPPARSTRPVYNAIPPSTSRFPQPSQPTQLPPPPLADFPSIPMNSEFYGLPLQRNLAAAVGRDTAVLVKDDFHAVTMLGQMPLEVTHFFRKLRNDRANFYAKVDNVVGYAMVVSRSLCYVWPYQKKPSSTPSTYYTFDMPEPPDPRSQNAETPLPLACLVNFEGRREPGLLACSYSGEFRYWEQVSYAFTGTERCLSMQVYLGEKGGYAAFLVDSEPAGFILSTNTSHLYRISLFNANGQSALSYSPLLRPVTMLNRFTAMFQTSTSLSGTGISDGTGAEEAEVVAIVNGDTPDGRHSREVFVVTGRSVQKWIVSKSYSEKFTFVRDIYSDIAERVFADAKVDFESASDLNLTIHDADYTRLGQLAVLVTYLAHPHKSNSAERKIGIIMLGVTTNSECTIKSMHYPKFSNLSAQPSNSARSHLTRPRLAISNGGHVAFVVLPETNTAMTFALISGSSFEEPRTFKDILLGFGVDRRGVRTHAHDVEDVSELAIVCMNSGIVNVEVNVSAVLREARVERAPENTAIAIEDHQARQTEQLKAKLEQAVFFGGSDDNPLTFSLSAGYAGDLDRAAESLSFEVLSSQSKHIPAIMDLRFHQLERLNRINAIVKFINANNLIDELSISTRYHLCWNAEKMAAAVDLWTYRNALLSRDQQTGRSARHRFLDDAINAYLCETQTEFPSEDAVRHFFVHHVAALGELLPLAQKPLKGIHWAHSGRLPQDSAQNHDKIAAVVEINRIFVILLKTAYTHRNASAQLYGLTEPSKEESWLATPDVLRCLELQYHLTDMALKEFPKEMDEILRNQDYEMELDERGDMMGERSSRAVAITLRDQLCDLADLMYRSFSERAATLKSASGDTEEHRQHIQRFAEVRGKVLEPLLSVGRSTIAFSLSERQRDFRALVDLSVLSSTGQSDVENLIQHYMRMFGRSFADTFYRYYIERGQLKNLFQLPDAHDESLQAFLELWEKESVAREENGAAEEFGSSVNEDLAQVTWLHDVKMGEYGRASEKMTRVSARETMLAHRVLALSLGKLFTCAAGADKNALDKLPTTLDDALNFALVQERFENHLRRDMAEMEMEPSADGLTVNLMPRLAQDFPALAEYYVHNARRIIKNEIVNLEDLTEMLSLRTYDWRECDPTWNEPLDILWYTDSPDYVPSNQDIPENRREPLLRALWRRAMIQDPWEEYLAQRKDMTDEDFCNVLRETRLFKMAHRGVFGEMYQKFFLEPARVYDHSTRDDLRIRFFDHDERDLDSMLRNLKEENRRLDELIMQYSLKDFWNEVMRLAVEQGSVKRMRIE